MESRVHQAALKVRREIHLHYLLRVIKDHRVLLVVRDRREILEI